MSNEETEKQATEVADAEVEVTEAVEKAEETATDEQVDETDADDAVEKADETDEVDEVAEAVTEADPMLVLTNAVIALSSQMSDVLAAISKSTETVEETVEDTAEKSTTEEEDSAEVEKAAETVEEAVDVAALVAKAVADAVKELAATHKSEIETLRAEIVALGAEEVDKSQSVLKSKVDDEESMVQKYRRETEGLSGDEKLKAVVGFGLRVR